MGVDMEMITNGPAVNECLETNIDGVFACGNVLHVHDLVDYVSEEAAAAGKNAAKYVQNNGSVGELGKEIPLIATGGVRYTVPKTIHVNRMEDELIVRFRVGAVYQNSYISAYLNDKRIIHRKKQIMAPGEMEEIKLKKAELEAFEATEHLENITVKIEEA